MTKIESDDWMTIADIIRDEPSDVIEDNDAERDVACAEVIVMRLPPHRQEKPPYSFIFNALRIYDPGSFTPQQLEAYPSIENLSPDQKAFLHYIVLNLRWEKASITEIDTWINRFVATALHHSAASKR